jgi:hypothetical protein
MLPFRLSVLIVESQGRVFPASDWLLQSIDLKTLYAQGALDTKGSIHLYSGPQKATSRHLTFTQLVFENIESYN